MSELGSFIFKSNDTKVAKVGKKNWIMFAFDVMNYFCFRLEFEVTEVTSEEGRV